MDWRAILLDHVLNFVCLSLLALIGYFIKKDYTRNEEQMTEFSNNMKIWDASIKQQFADTRRHLATHSDSLGKFEKTVNTAVAALNENIYKVKNELFDRIERTKFASQEAEQKLGRVIELKRDVSVAHGKIILLEQNTGKMSVELSESKKNIRNLGQIVKMTRDELGNLKGKK